MEIEYHTLPAYNVPGGVEHYKLIRHASRGMEALTMFHVPIPKGLGDSLLHDFKEDIVFAEVESNPGEFHARHIIRHDCEATTTIVS